MASMDLQPIGYKFVDAAKLLTLSRGHIYKLVEDGKLERIQVTEGRYVITYESLVAYMDAARAGKDMKTYTYQVKVQRPGSRGNPQAQDEKKGVVSGLLARFGLGGAG